MTLPQLQRLCRVWQRRLRLQDWKVTIRLQSEVRVDEAEAWGALETLPDEVGTPKAAIVELDESADDTRLEAALVHELLHIRLLPFDGEEEGLREEAINLLADCFLQAYPKRRRRPDGINSTPGSSPTTGDRET